MTDTPNRKEVISEDTGVATCQIGTISEREVLAMMESGLLVALHISYFRPYTQLDEKDLGIEGNGELRKVVELGRRVLLPKAVISTIETVERQARTALKKCSIRCYWGSFVPSTAWARWKEESSKFRTKFFKVRDNIINDLPSSKTLLEETYRNLASDAFRRSTMNATAEVPPEFIGNFVEVCMRRFPTAEVIMASFNYTEVYNYIPLPMQISEHMESMLRGNLQQEIAIEMRANKDRVLAGFYSEVTGGLREMMAKVAESVRVSIANNSGTLIPKATSDLKRMLEKIDLLNFYDDSELSSMVAEIRAEVDKPLKDRDGPTINDVLGNVLTTCKDQIELLTAQKESRYDALEIK